MIKLCLSVQPISIHAPREGGDEVTGVIQVIPCTISIHAPREGGDEVQSDAGAEDKVFQSTPPARGATRRSCAGLCYEKFQSTPPARGATRRLWRRHGSGAISIHAPREGGDHLKSFCTAIDI